jgi:hypothetical protein
MTVTNPATESNGVGGVLRAVLAFTAAQAVLVLLAATILQRVVFTDAMSGQAVRASAWLAVSVQLVSFAIARLVARQQMIAGWGLGVMMRFAVVAFWAFLGIKAFGLLPAPALISLVLFFFVSTLIEPIFLNVG